MVVLVEDDLKDVSREATKEALELTKSRHRKEPQSKYGVAYGLFVCPTPEVHHPFLLGVSNYFIGTPIVRLPKLNPTLPSQLPYQSSQR